MQTIKFVKRPKATEAGCNDSRGRRSLGYDAVWEAALRTRGTQKAVKVPREYASSPKRLQQFRNGIRHRARYTEPRPSVVLYMDKKHTYLWLTPWNKPIPPRQGG